MPLVSDFLGLEVSEVWFQLLSLESLWFSHCAQDILRCAITSMNSWSFLVCFPAWNLKCRTQHDILSRIYQVGFIEEIGRWLSPVSPNWRCCYTSQATEQREKFKSPGSPWMLSYLRELERKGTGPNFLCLSRPYCVVGNS